MTSEQPSEYVSEQGYEGERSEGGTTVYTDQTTEGGIEEDDMDDKFPKIGDSEEDEEQKQKYQEYLQLIKEIEAQNKVLEGMKERILELCEKPCKTACDEKEIRDTRTCMETENLKLKCLINKAIDLQNGGPHRLWEEIPITTTFDEDNLKPYVHCTSRKKYAPESSEKTCSTKSSSLQLPCICQEFYEKKKKTRPYPCPVCPEKDSEECHVREILCGLKKLKISCPEDKQMLCEIINALKKKSPKPCQPFPQPCPPPPCYKPCCKHTQPSPGMDEDDFTLQHLKEKVCGMHRAVERIQKEIAKRERNGKAGKIPCPCATENDAIIECGGKLNDKARQIEKMKENYCYLLTEYAKKEAELRQIKQR